MYHLASTDLTVGDEPAQEVEQGRRVVFDLLGALWIGVPVGTSGGSAQAPKCRGAFLQRIDCRPQRRLYGFALLGKQSLDAEGVADTAFEAKAVGFAHLPERAPALWTGQAAGPVRQLRTRLLVGLISGVDRWLRLTALTWLHRCFLERVVGKLDEACGDVGCAKAIVDATGAQRALGHTREEGFVGILDNRDSPV